MARKENNLMFFYVWKKWRKSVEKNLYKCFANLKENSSESSEQSCGVGNEKKAAKVMVKAVNLYDTK